MIVDWLCFCWFEWLINTIRQNIHHAVVQRRSGCRELTRGRWERRIKLKSSKRRRVSALQPTFLNHLRRLFCTESCSAFQRTTHRQFFTRHRAHRRLSQVSRFNRRSPRPHVIRGSYACLPAAAPLSAVHVITIDVCCPSVDSTGPARPAGKQCAIHARPLIRICSVQLSPIVQVSHHSVCFALWLVTWLWTDQGSLPRKPDLDHLTSWNASVTSTWQDLFGFSSALKELVFCLVC